MSDLISVKLHLFDSARDDAELQELTQQLWDAMDAMDGVAAVNLVARSPSPQAENLERGAEPKRIESRGIEKGTQWLPGWLTAEIQPGKMLAVAQKVGQRLFAAGIEIELSRQNVAGGKSIKVKANSLEEFDKVMASEAVRRFLGEKV